MKFPKPKDLSGILFIGVLLAILFLVFLAKVPPTPTLTYSQLQTAIATNQVASVSYNTAQSSMLVTVKPGFVPTVESDLASPAPVSSVASAPSASARTSPASALLPASAPVASASSSTTSRLAHPSPSVSASGPHAQAPVSAPRSATAPSSTASAVSSSPASPSSSASLTPSTPNDATLPTRYRVRVTFNDQLTLSALAAHHVPVFIIHDTSPWQTFWSFAPLLIILGLLLWFLHRFSQRSSSLTNKGEVNVTPSQDNPVRFNDVAGCEEAKQEVIEVVDFLKHPQIYANVGGKVPHGVLMAGPPGTGKTLLAKAIAGEAGVPFISISGSDFVEMFVGVGAARVRNLFKKAKAHSPCIIFIDEIDAVAKARTNIAGGGANDERDQTLNQMLVEMDGFSDKSGVIVIAATNRPDTLDQALLRPGRFDRTVTLGLPDKSGRAAILAVHGRHVPLANDVDWDLIAQGTPGFSGADLANLINEAAIYAARERSRLVRAIHFEQARDKIIMGVEKKTGVPLEKTRRLTAYHEAGHTIVALHTPEAEPLHKVSIIPRGRALGVTIQLPAEDVVGYSRTGLLTRLKILMGGRAAEDLVLGDISTGASNDFEKASQLARAMVTEWGMSPTLGVVNFKNDNPYHSLWSETLRARADNEILALLNDSYAQAKQLLQAHWAELEALAQALLKSETLNREEVLAICQAASAPAPATP